MQFKTSILLCFFIGISYGQTKNEVLAQKVFNNITNSVGNNFPSPPKLNFINSVDKIAYTYNGSVFLEKKALNLLCSFDDSQDALAYVLSHELAHHYLNHTWMKNIGFTYTSELKNQLNKDVKSINNRKIEETQADLFGGFFSQISGYNSLTIAENVLKLLYKNYNLPETIEGYPSLTDRENIVKNNLEELDKLSIVFKMGNLMVATEDYKNALKCYEHILSKKFTSREIYNNLGAIYLKQAIDFDDNLSKYSFPILFEENTRATTKDIYRRFDGLSESKIKDTIIYHLNLADDAFNRSSVLDKNFMKPKVNLLISELINNKITKTNLDLDFGKRLEQLKLSITDENDINLLSFYLGLVPKIDENEKIKKSSIISKYNKEVFHNTTSSDSLQNLNVKNEFSNLINELKFTHLNKVDKTISSGDGINIKINKTTNYEVYEYNKSKYFIEVSKANLSKINGLSENLDKDAIFTKFGKPTSIYKINNLLYLNYSKNKFVIVLSENQLLEIIYYN
ncbi:M48 family metalloprotease [Flavobacterium aciduliphilum]|uniref:Peptidase M48-like protein n=1 Tax=Flavobacterium aciduliphilum TaxID=1101402 RepID=A0A328YFP0_9FLAO|nr:M48 family metalloprotease [Flavobacterium aciduliphilum]RAR71495.1 peptidase M48-like protein [Flavobacterium aciduliphilum]